MKKILISVLFLFVTMVSYSQIKVLSIEPDEADLTARINPKQDRNGFNCALLKITTIGIDGEQRRKFFFTGDMATQIVDVSFPPGEIWVYLSPGRSQLVIRHDDYGKTIYDMPYALKEKTCYAMVITADKEVNNVVRNYLIIKADQPNALIYVDDVFVGEKEVFLLYNAGETHQYRIECDMYYSEKGEAKINYTENTTIEKVLRPAFGYLNVTSMPEDGATVYINGKKVGETPYMMNKMKSGEYKVRVVKEMYYPEEKSYVVRDGETTEAKIEMRGNYANVTVETGAEAEIYVDNEYKGTGSWTGKLMGGEHLFEARKESHNTTTVNVRLTAGKDEKVVIPNPKPVLGTLNVATIPMGVKIYIDGKEEGSTPRYITDVLIGTHELKLEMNGYVTIIKTVEVKESKVVNVNEKMVSEKTGLENMVGNNEEIVSTGNKVIDVKGIKIEMVYVEGGTFEMGATKEQGNNVYDYEKPTHRVILNDYYIGKYEVTQELWKAVMNENPSWYIEDKRPVEQVSWENCQKFIDKLNELTGEMFRLPTEAEWEYAARGGNRGKGYKYSGSNDISEVAWFGENSLLETHVVGKKKANELGIYDMSGNVWEWCSDWYGPYGSEEQTNPKGPKSGSYRVHRGGSWYDNLNNCRVSDRNYNEPNDQYSNLGFRLVLVP